MAVAQPRRGRDPAEIDIVEEWGEQSFPASDAPQTGSGLIQGVALSPRTRVPDPQRATLILDGRLDPGPVSTPYRVGARTDGCAPRWSLPASTGHGGVMTVTTCPTTPLASPLSQWCAAAPRGPWLLRDRRPPGR
jgi:hypothetical protein